MSAVEYTTNTAKIEVGIGSDGKVTRYAKTVLIVCLCGYIFDAMEVMLYSMTLAPICKTFGLDLTTGGLIMTLSLMGYACGSTFWGYISDKYGRLFVLTWTVGLYAIFTGTTVLAMSVPFLIVSRFLTGFAAGGEWSAGAALVSENWPTKYRGRAMAVMQAGWPLGIMFAAVINMTIAPHFGWRGVFAAGIVPAILVFFVRRTLHESDAFLALKKKRAEFMAKPYNQLTDDEKELRRNPIIIMFTRRYIRTTMLIIIAGSAVLVAYWGCLTWLPTYFQVIKGWGIAKSSTWMIVLNVSAAVGYQIYGLVAEKIGRRLSLTLYFIAVMIMMPIFIYAITPGLLLVSCVLLGLSFSFFPGFPLWASELYPTHIRVTGFGVTYSTIARFVSTIAPYGLAVYSAKAGWEMALWTTPLVLIIAIIAVWTLGVETRGRELLD